MTDVIESQVESQTNVGVIQEEQPDYKSLYEKTKADLEAVAKKKDELLTETKRAKEARREADEAAIKAATEKAIKDGEFERLWKTSQEEKTSLEKKLQEIVTSSRREKIQVRAMQLANDLADGDNAELLSEFVQRRLDNVADEGGTVTSDVLNAIKEDFKNNGKYKALLRGSKAAGGGATGNMGSAQQNNIVTRAQFNAMSPGEQSKFALNRSNSIVDSL